MLTSGSFIRLHSLFALLIMDLNRVDLLISRDLSYWKIRFSDDKHSQALVQACTYELSVRCADCSIAQMFVSSWGQILFGP